jgi:hypothetical protein
MLPELLEGVAAIQRVACGGTCEKQLDFPGDK